MENNIEVQREAPFNNINPSRLVIYSVITIGIFDLFYFYKSWKHLKTKENLSISPFWRAIFAIFFCYDYFERVFNEATKYKYLSKFSPKWLAAYYIFTLLASAAWANATFLEPITDFIIFMFLFTSTIPLYLVQKAAVFSNISCNPELSKVPKLSGMQLVGIALGTFFLVFVIFGILFPVYE